MIGTHHDPSAELVRLSLLGGFRLERAGAPLEVSANGRRLVAALALLGPMLRARAAELLWPEVPPCRALGSLRTMVWRLRRTAPDLIDPSEDHLRLGPEVQVDVSAFTGWAAGLVRRDLALDGPIPPWDELLPEWDDEWMRFERERLRQLRLHALEALARQRCALGRFSEAASAAREAIRLAPLRESAHHTLIAVYLAQDDTARARSQFTVFARLLDDRLGVEPSARLRALVGAGQCENAAESTTKPRS